MKHLIIVILMLLPLAADAASPSYRRYDFFITERICEKCKATIEGGYITQMTEKNGKALQLFCGEPIYDYENATTWKSDPNSSTCKPLHPEWANPHASNREPN